MKREDVLPEVVVYFATNRKPLTGADGQKIVDFGSELGPIGGLAVRYGSIRVTVERGKAALVKDSLVVAPEQLIGPADFIPKLGSNTIFDALRQSMKTQNRPTLVFVHGFSNSFTDAAERAATIKDFYGIDANIFAFSWPSRASPVLVPLPYEDYAHDRRTAAASGRAIARTLERLYDYVEALAPRERCQQELHLLCHSMGNYALRFGLQELMASNATAGPAAPFSASTTPEPDPGKIRRTFDQIVLAAADEDADAFDDPRKLKYLPRLGNDVTVYHTRRDWVLSTVSAITKFNGPRLGTDGPDNMDSISDKVSAVDVSEVITVGEDFESHQYYRRDPFVRDDIVNVLSGKRPDEIPGRSSVMTGRWRLVRRQSRRTTPRKRRG